MPLQPCPSHRLVWIGVPSRLDDNLIQYDTFLHIPIDLADIKLLGDPRLAWFASSARVQQLKARLGPYFIAQDGDILYVHQLVISALCACSETGVSVEFFNWANMMDLTCATDPLPFGRDSSVTVFIACNHHENPSVMEKLCQRLEVAQKTARYDLHIIPSLAELRFKDHKMGDIKALDEMAKQTDDHRFSHRPRTCFGQGPCMLSMISNGRITHSTNGVPGNNGRMVVKGTHSSAGANVWVRKMSSRQHLKCDLPDLSPAPDRSTRSRHRRIPQPLRQHQGGKGSIATIDRQRDDHVGDLKDGEVSFGRNYFHQEYVDSLRSFGEIRAFVIKDEIVSIAMTKTAAEPCNRSHKGAPLSQHIFVVRQLDPRIDLAPLAVNSTISTGGDKEAGRAKLAELHEFIHHVHKTLMARHDANEHFRSLWMGVRYDCGFTLDGDGEGRFFVNEITRISSAAYFSVHLFPKPFLDICDKFGTELGEEIRRSCGPSLAETHRKRKGCHLTWGEGQLEGEVVDLVVYDTFSTS